MLIGMCCNTVCSACDMLKIFTLCFDLTICYAFDVFTNNSAARDKKKSCEFVLKLKIDNGGSGKNMLYFVHYVFSVVYRLCVHNLSPHYIISRANSSYQGVRGLGRIHRSVILR